jgi:hypothetical protein
MEHLRKNAYHWTLSYAEFECMHYMYSRQLMCGLLIMSLLCLYCLHSWLVPIFANRYHRLSWFCERLQQELTEWMLNEQCDGSHAAVSEIENRHKHYTTSVPFWETCYVHYLLIAPRGLWSAAHLGLKALSSIAAADTTSPLCYITILSVHPLGSFIDANLTRVFLTTRRWRYLMCVQWH